MSALEKDEAVVCPAAPLCTWRSEEPEELSEHVASCRYARFLDAARAPLVAEISQLRAELSAVRSARGRRLLTGAKLAQSTFLHGAALTAADFVGADVTEADLGASCLLYADLSAASAHRATFSEAVLCNSRLVGLRANGAKFNGCDLRGATFEFASLRGASFADASLQSCSFRRAKLRDCVLARANLSDADLRSASFRGADMHGVVATRARLDNAHLHGANLTGAVLRKASVHRTLFSSDTVFRKCDLRSVNFEHRDLSGFLFSRADLRGAGLSGVNFSGAKLRKCSLQGQNLSGVALEGASLDGAKLCGAVLCAAKLTNCSLVGADLSGAVLHGVNLSGADLSGAILEDANLSGALVREARFSVSTRFARANFSGCDLRGCSFVRFSMPSVSFAGANLEGTNFRLANLANASLQDALIVPGKTILAEADLSGVDLKHRDLKHWDLRGCTLFGANAAGCKFEGSAVGVFSRFRGPVSTQDGGFSVTHTRQSQELAVAMSRRKFVLGSKKGVVSHFWEFVVRESGVSAGIVDASFKSFKGANLLKWPGHRVFLADTGEVLNSDGVLVNVWPQTFKPGDRLGVLCDTLERSVVFLKNGRPTARITGLPMISFYFCVALSPVGPSSIAINRMEENSSVLLGDALFRPPLHFAPSQVARAESAGDLLDVEKMLLLVRCLGIKDLCRMQQLSRHWYDLCKANDLWRCALQNDMRHWPTSSAHMAYSWLQRFPPGAEESAVSWKRVCFDLLVPRVCWNPECPTPVFRIVDCTACSTVGGHQHRPPEPEAPHKAKRNLRKSLSMTFRL